MQHFRSDEGYNFFLFTFFYLHSDLMAIKKREKRDKSECRNVRKKKRITQNKENHNARCEFQYTPQCVYTMSLLRHDNLEFTQCFFFKLFYFLLADDLAA